MDFDRGVLARIDRKLLAGLGQHETYRMVRVPVSASQWSTWKRYCDSAGISMGRAIMALIEHELVTVFSESTGDAVPVFAEQAEESWPDATSRSPAERWTRRESRNAYERGISDCAGGRASSRPANGEPSSR
jgi:hypothetical protein